MKSKIIFTLLYSYANLFKLLSSSDYPLFKVYRYISYLNHTVR